MRRAHARCFGSERDTDVISLAYRPSVPGEGWTGEILVNPSLALQAGPPAAARRELALYIAHGCDHLCGGRDERRGDRVRMLRREHRWLAAARRRGLSPEALPLISARQR